MDRLDHAICTEGDSVAKFFSTWGYFFLADLQTFSYSKVIDNFLHSLQIGKEGNNLKEVK